MSLNAGQLARIRRMVNDVAEDFFTDAEIDSTADAMARIRDAAGRAPVHDDYVPTYDLYLLAAELWRLKAGEFAEQFDFNAEGGEFSRSQKYHMAVAQSKRYADMAAQRSTHTGIG